MKALNAPQRKVKIKISVNFYFNTTVMHGAGRVKFPFSKFRFE